MSHPGPVSQLRGSLIKFIGPGATQIPFPESAAIVTNHRVMSRDLVTMSRDPEFQKRNKKQFYALLRNRDRKEVYLSRYPGYIYLGLKSAQVYDNFVAEISRSRIGREQRSIIIKLF